MLCKVVFSYRVLRFLWYYALTISWKSGMVLFNVSAAFQHKGSIRQNELFFYLFPSGMDSKAQQTQQTKKFMKRFKTRFKATEWPPYLQTVVWLESRERCYVLRQTCDCSRLCFWQSLSSNFLSATALNAYMHIHIKTASSLPFVFFSLSFFNQWVSNVWLRFTISAASSCVSYWILTHRVRGQICS